MQLGVGAGALCRKIVVSHGLQTAGRIRHTERMDNSKSPSSITRRCILCGLCPRRPNPSIEGTSTIRLRLFAAAPHVKR